MDIKEVESCLYGLRETIKAMGYVKVVCHYDIKTDEDNHLWIHLHLPFPKPSTLRFDECLYRRHDPEKSLQDFLTDVVSEICMSYGRASEWQIKVAMAALAEAREVCKSAIGDDDLHKVFDDVEKTIAAEMERISKNAIQGASI